jgi:hypothetical protein
MRFVNAAIFLLTKLCQIMLKTPCFNTALPILLQKLSEYSRYWTFCSLQNNIIDSQAALTSNMSGSKDFDK